MELGLRLGTRWQQLDRLLCSNASPLLLQFWMSHTQRLLSLLGRIRCIQVVMNIWPSNPTWTRCPLLRLLALSKPIGESLIALIEVHRRPLWLSSCINPLGKLVILCKDILIVLKFSTRVDVAVALHDHAWWGLLLGNLGTLLSADRVDVGALVLLAPDLLLDWGVNRATVGVEAAEVLRLVLGVSCLGLFLVELNVAAGYVDFVCGSVEAAWSLTLELLRLAQHCGELGYSLASLFQLVCCWVQSVETLLKLHRC